MDYSRHDWQPNEREFLEICATIGVPRKVVAETIGLRLVPVKRMTEQMGAMAARELHLHYKFEEYKERYLNDPVERVESNHVNWTKKLNRFVEKCYLLGISLETIAEELGVSKQTIKRRVTKFDLSAKKQRLLERFATLAAQRFL